MLGADFATAFEWFRIGCCMIWRCCYDSGMFGIDAGMVLVCFWRFDNLLTMCFYVVVCVCVCVCVCVYVYVWMWVIYIDDVNGLPRCMIIFCFNVSNSRVSAFFTLPFHLWVASSTSNSFLGVVRVKGGHRGGRNHHWNDPESAARYPAFCCQC